ncbi:Growth-regulating factor 8 [Bienertia sinuspersici]
MLSMTKNISNSNSNEFGVSSKKFQEGEVVVVELGLKLQQDQDRSFQFNHSTRAVADHDDDDDDDGDGSCGPTCNGYNMFSNTPIYSFATPIAGDSSSVHSSTTTTTSVPASAGVVRGLQPFDVSSYYSSTNPFFKSSGGMATTTMGFPFTASQWKELERQAMIYKYMMASLPVPPDLLYSSFPTNFSTSSTFAPASYCMSLLAVLGKYGSGISMRWSGNSKDAEPGRCRRTDGKKWRCSRDVAPNQKYCERHMHRGRPRSRKHVELQQQQQQQQNHHSSITNLSFNNNNSKDKVEEDNSPTKKTCLSDSLLSSNINHCVGSSVQPSPKVSIFDHSLGSASTNNPSFDDNSRNLGWTNEQQWNQLVQTNMNSSVFQHQFDGEPLNLNANVGFNPKSDDMCLLERPLIDAWSNSTSKLSLSSSYGRNNNANANAIDEEMCQIHMGLGLIDSWVGSTTSTPGGPLAEVLRPGNPAMSDGGESEFVTPPATTVSSPSGVLQKTFATFSDSSGSTSPTTCHNSKPNSDMPFHWLN